MKLIGQYDSPFVRRVAIALIRYDMDFESLPFSVMREWEKFSAHNPLRRVPTLLLDDGEALIDSDAILDHLDEVAGAQAALIPQSGAARRAALHRIALATGLADKAVSFFYMNLFSQAIDPSFRQRCEDQLRDGMKALDAECAGRTEAWWGGDGPGHDDIALACVARFLSEAWPDIVTLSDTPALAAHCAAAEARDEFRATAKPFDPPR